MSAHDKTVQQTYPYTLLRTAMALFNKTPDALAEEELSQAERQARNEIKIETRILNSPEAAAVILTEETLNTAYQEVVNQYPDEQAFIQDLQKNHLNDESLRAALYRQCKVNVIMDLIGSRSPSVSEIEIGIYYHMHPEQFNRPEVREVCHIYISINPDYPENTRAMALQRIQDIQTKLLKKPYKFADYALKHSECPTSLQGGLLGTVPRGKLYPELDAALFTLKAGQISAVLESEIGFHVLLCKAIHSAETLSLQKATPKIRDRMKTRAQRICQRAWLAALPDAINGHEGVKVISKNTSSEDNASAATPTSETKRKPS